MKRKAFLALVAAMFIVFAACGGNEPAPAPTPVVEQPPADAPPVEAPPVEAPPVEAPPAAEVPSGVIHVITREAGSGTRDAFVEVTGILEDGEDRTWEEAPVATGTGAVITTISENPAAMGYISLGAVREGIRALPVNGAEATVENIRAGTYPLFRSFYLAVPEELSDLAHAFIAFIDSEVGQDIIAGQGYIPTVESPTAFIGDGLSGTIVIEGSTSVAPLMNALGAAFSEAVGGGVTVDVHSTGSGAGITAAIEGRVDLGMSSRSLREGELAQVGSITMAHDGIAVIVHPTNGLASVSVDEIRQIFMGELNRWDDIN